METTSYLAAACSPALLLTCLHLSALAEDKTPPIEDYVARESYFEQRADRPDLRSWQVESQPLPPLDSILRATPESRPIYGLYCWADEYIKAHAEIERLGIRSIRFSGPFEEKDEAFLLAARNGVEILSTLSIGGTSQTQKLRREDFDSDEAFREAYRDTLVTFLERFGPGGTAFEGTGLKSPVGVVEIFNEPNFRYLIGGGGDPQTIGQRRQELYALVLAAAHQTVNERWPGIRIAAFAAGGSRGLDLPFITAVHALQPDVIQAYDILSTHPYTLGAPPEATTVQTERPSYSLPANLYRLREMMTALGGPRPVWYTELGWHIAREHGGRFDTYLKYWHKPVPPDLHAAYIARLFLYGIRLGIGRIHLMYLHDTDDFNGGLMHRDTFEWRPAAHAVRQLTTLLPHPRLSAAPSDGVDGLFVYEFQSDHRAAKPTPVIAVWNVSGPRKTEVTVPAARMRVYDMIGNHRDLTAANGLLTLEAGPYPVYLTPQPD